MQTACGCAGRGTCSHTAAAGGGEGTRRLETFRGRGRIGWVPAAPTLTNRLHDEMASPSWVAARHLVCVTWVACGGLCRPRMRWLDVESLILEIEVTGDSDPDIVADCACATEIKERFPLGVQQLTAQALVVL